MASDAESDGFGVFDFAEFTSDDFAQIDRDIASRFTESNAVLLDLEGDPTPATEEASPSSGSSGEQEQDKGDERREDDYLDNASESFEFDASLDLCTLAEEDLLAIDDVVNLRMNAIGAEEPEELVPAPVILDAPRIEEAEVIVEVDAKPRWRYNGKKNGKMWKDKSLLERHKPSGILSVTDLVSPTWYVLHTIVITTTRVSDPILYFNTRIFLS